MKKVFRVYYLDDDGHRQHVLFEGSRNACNDVMEAFRNYNGAEDVTCEKYIKDDILRELYKLIGQLKPSNKGYDKVQKVIDDREIRVDLKDTMDNLYAEKA